ncbi:uncharacterized protein H6S33_012442 [Morchella sextelata]|uniref:uncharacterized protein n=1 Tax=Morchella sextelata TaxID=1174677 RepID=UPI001D04E8C0|nr:uncharacterized protein H6S33_012442 [Morchella sextelata]KAH0609896.1 hypothetical protein H6S33_012442 [Morchella sextelata]
MSRELSYPKTPINKVNRYNQRASYDASTIHRIVNTTSVLHVSFVVPSDPKDPSSAPLPMILPMIGQMGSFDYPSSDETDALDCYLHGYVSSRIINLARGVEGIPLCVAATKIDGFVLSLTPNSHSYNYRSAILHGTATLVIDPAEKLYAMELITNSVIPDRWNHTRIPPDEAEMSSTSVLKLKISSASAKVRTGPPLDEKKDNERPGLREKVWTGVVPVFEALGVPIPGPDNAVDEVPEYVGVYVEKRNKAEKMHADLVGSTMGKKGS